MALYNVEVKEELSRVVEQEANSYEEAEDIVASRYAEEDIVLDWEDLNYTKYEPYPPQKLKDDFNLEISFDKESEDLVIGTDNSSGAKYNCKTIEDLKIAFNDYIENYIDLEELKIAENKLEV